MRPSITLHWIELDGVGWITLAAVTNSPFRNRQQPELFSAQCRIGSPSENPPAPGRVSPVLTRTGERKGGS